MLFNVSCKESTSTAKIEFSEDSNNASLNKKIFPGAYSTAKYIPLLKNKKVALVVNQSSMIEDVHLSDTLLSLDIDIVKIFAPEHGFRGKANAGAEIKDGIDTKTGLPVISLYGKKEKPSKSDLKDVDVIVFDIQDVGVRFYTYISTMKYVMDAAAENNIQFIVLDRPNPNGHYIDGPMLDEKYKSFVGIIPIPVVYGMTMGELAKMINGENWIEGSRQCNLEVIECTNYTHNSHYELPIAPSPNLQDMLAISLYPSLCFFEGTKISVGRGTDIPFKQIGHPRLKNHYKYSFTPIPNFGAKYPKNKNKVCYGIDLSNIKTKDFRFKKKIELSWIVDFYNNFDEKEEFFLKNNWIDKLAGTDQLRKMIIEGKSEEEIRDSWKKDLEEFNKKRKKYLLYPDFE